MFRFIERLTTPRNDAEGIHLLQTRPFFVNVYVPLFTFRRRYTTASNFIYKSPWNLPFETVRVRRGSWTDTITSFHTIFVSLYCVATIAQSLVPGERPSQLWATIRHSFFPPSHVSDRFWINRNRARRTFYPWLEDGRHRRRLFVFDPPLRIVLFNPREI